MSDQTPEAAPSQAPVESAPTEQPRELDAPAQPVEATGEPEEKAEAKEPGKPESKGVQKRLDEMRRQIGDTQRLNEELVGLLKSQMLGGKLPEPAAGGPPRQENFNTVQDFQRAQAAFHRDEIAKEVKAEVGRIKAEESKTQQVTSWNAKQAEMAAKHSDYYEVVGDESLSITPNMTAAILDSDKPAEVAYYLGKNPDEAARIATLSEVGQVREITKIEARLTDKETPSKPVSKAPAPISPVGNGRSGTVNLETASMDDYVAARQAQGASWAPRKR